MSKIKLHIIIIIFCLPALQGYSQKNLPESFRKYQETVWLISERHLYFPGEIIRFNAAVLEKDTYFKSGLSNVVRVELLNPQGEAVEQLNLQLDKARSKGLIQLPGDLKTGYYYLRAYTNWMRNFPASNYGMLTIKVVNPSDPMPGLSEEERVTYSSASDQYIDVIDEGEYLGILIGDEAFDNRDSLRLVIHQSYTVVVDSIFTKRSDIDIHIPGKDLPAGIFQISLLAKDDIISKRLWSYYMPESREIDIDLSDSILGVRNSYSIDFSSSSRVQELFVSVSLDEPDYPSEKYIPGLPGWNCNTNIPSDNEGFKEWLSNNSYRDDVVFGILNEVEDLSVNQGFFYLPEIQSGVISGKVVRSDTKEGQSKAGVCLSILNDNYFDAATTDEQGQFYFALPGHSGSNDIIINLTSFEDTMLQIELMPLFDTESNINYRELTLTKAEFEFLQKQNINHQLRNIYGAHPVIPSAKTQVIKSRETFFHPPDYTCLVDKYIKLANVGEVIYEVVPMVSVRRRNGLENLHVYNGHPNADFYETLVLLDGVPLADQSALLDLPPDRIEIIEVKNKLYIHGRSIFSSIVNFVSTNRDYAGLELPKSSVLSTLNLPIRAISGMNTENYTPNRLPKLENSLIWCSEITGNSDNIEFQTNDLKGDFKVYFHGFDDSGNWIYGSRKFKVE